MHSEIMMFLLIKQHNVLYRPATTRGMTETRRNEEGVGVRRWVRRWHRIDTVSTMYQNLPFETIPTAVASVAQYRVLTQSE